MGDKLASPGCDKKQAARPPGNIKSRSKNPAIDDLVGKVKAREGPLREERPLVPLPREAGT
jgi:hypothetical protein